MPTTFANHLAAIRKEYKISQKEAAAKLGISQALLSHYEKGIRECGLDFLCRAADYYGVTTDYLLGRSKSRTVFEEALDSHENTHTDTDFSTMTVFRAASYLEELMDARESDDNPLSRAYALLVYRIVLEKIKRGQIPASWLPADAVFVSPLYHMLLEQTIRDLVTATSLRQPVPDSPNTSMQTIIDDLRVYISEHFLQQTPLVQELQDPGTPR